MKNIFKNPVITILLLFIISATVITCSKQHKYESLSEEVTTKAQLSKSCFTVCDATKTPDITIVTNAQEERPLLPDGEIDRLTYFFTKYGVRTHPIHLDQNYLVPASYTIRYGWDSGVLVNRVRLQCLIENIAPFGCHNDWVFEESQGYISPLLNYFFDGLFEFDTYEKGNGNNWKHLYTDFKKEFHPSSIPNQDYIYNNDFCYYNRSIQAQMGDFYYNYFRFPNHDGIYKLVIKFNPQIRGCRAVKESNYSNNNVEIILQIINGTVIILNHTT